MIGLLCFVLAVLASPFKSEIRLEAENAALRNQLIVLRRKLRGRALLANSDRLFFVRYIGGFYRSREFSRSSILRHWFVGIEPVSQPQGQQGSG